jgi:hypothetical protein
MLDPSLRVTVPPSESNRAIIPVGKQGEQDDMVGKKNMSMPELWKKSAGSPPAKKYYLHLKISASALFKYICI